MALPSTYSRSCVITLERSREHWSPDFRTQKFKYSVKIGVRLEVYFFISLFDTHFFFANGRVLSKIFICATAAKCIKSRELAVELCLLFFVDGALDDLPYDAQRSYRTW